MMEAERVKGWRQLGFSSYCLLPAPARQGWLSMTSLVIIALAFLMGVIFAKHNPDLIEKIVERIRFVLNYIKNVGGI